MEEAGLRRGAGAEPWKKPDCGAARRGSGAVEEELWCTVGAGQRENSGLAESTGNVEMEQAVGYVSGIFFVVGDF